MPTAQQREGGDAQQRWGGDAQQKMAVSDNVIDHLGGAASTARCVDGLQCSDKVGVALRLCVDLHRSVV